MGPSSCADLGPIHLSEHQIHRSKHQLSEHVAEHLSEHLSDDEQFTVVLQHQLQPLVLPQPSQT